VPFFLSKKLVRGIINYSVLATGVIYRRIRQRMNMCREFVGMGKAVVPFSRYRSSSSRNSGETEKNLKNPVRIAGAPAGFRTGHVPKFRCVTALLTAYVCFDCVDPGESSPHFLVF
jgi:hypothetical protein